MITILVLCYVICVFVVFRVIKIRPTPASVAASVVVGVVMLGGVVIGWMMSAPMTGKMMLWRRVLEVIPDVREFVSQVHVESNQFIRKGEPLFEIRQDRFQDAVDQSMAQMAAAKATVTQLEAAVEAAEAAVRKSEADTGAARANLDTALAVKQELAGAIARLKVEETQQGFRAAQANEQVAKASLKQAQFSLASARHSVDVAQAAVSTATFNLARCTYESPVDGLTMNWQITEGTPAARWRFTSIGTVMDMSNTAIVAILPQNLLKNVKSGDDAEIAFKRRPGRIAAGKVEAIIKYTGEGQFLPDKSLPVAKDVGSKGFLAVRVRLDDEELARQLPLGAAGTVAIYTDVGKPFHLISKITVRMKGWLYYLPL